MGLIPKYIKVARAVIKAIKRGDTSLLDKYLDNVPEDVKSKIRNMVDAYNAYKEGRTSRSEVVKVVAANLGISSDDIDDLIDILDELLSEVNEKS